MKSMTQVFEEIYKTKAWVNKYTNAPSLSGPESFPGVTATYHALLKNFIEQHSIKSVVDYGCGDNAVYEGFDWNNTAYTGIDVSQTAIDLAQQRYPTHTYVCTETLDLPAADLLLCKDVLGPWSGIRSTQGLGDQRHLITEWLNLNYDKFPFIIITDGEKSQIDKYFPAHAKFNAQHIMFGKKQKKIYIKGN